MRLFNNFVIEIEQNYQSWSLLKFKFALGELVILCGFMDFPAYKVQAWSKTHELARLYLSLEDHSPEQDELAN